MGLKDKEAAKAYAAAWRLAHPGRNRLTSAAYDAAHQSERKAYRAAHKEETRARTAAWEKTHKERRRLLAAARYAATKEHHLAQQRRYVAANPEKRKLSQAAYRERSKEARRAYNSSYYEAHRAACNATTSAWAKSHPDEMRVVRSRRRARKHAGTTTRIKRKDLHAHLDRLGRQCVYCHGPYQELDHLVPLARGGPHSIDNLVPSCRSCNRRKQRRLPHEWLSPEHWAEVSRFLRQRGVPPAARAS